MILIQSEIISRLQQGDISISPFNAGDLGTNSYDVHLGHELMEYVLGPCGTLDPARDNPTSRFHIPQMGYRLVPGDFVLGSVAEDMELRANDLIPMIEGVSSLARLGLSIHQTAGFGDVGFSGKWTLELSCLKPIRLYPGMRIGQVYWIRCAPSEVRYSGRYQGGEMAASREWVRHLPTGGIETK